MEMPDELKAAEDAVNALKRAVVTDEQIPDTAGVTRGLEMRLAEFRRALVSEASDHAEGEYYRIEDVNKGMRSYSVWNIVKDYAEATGQSMIEALAELHGEDVIRMTVHWSNLQMAANRARMDLKIHQGEISPDDADHHVGVYYKTDRRVVGIPMEERR